MSGFLNLKPAAAAASTFTVTWDCSDAAALPASDWKASDPHTVNGVVMTSHNDAATDVVELDGSTGLVMRTANGVRSIPYANVAPATMLLADVQASVGGSWNQYTERLFFQARFNGSTALYEGCGITLAESLTPLDDAQVFFGTANGNVQYQLEASRARSTPITPPADILAEIIMDQWGMTRWRLVAWPGDWPAPDTFTPLSVTNGYYLDGTPTSHVMDLAADKWTPGNATWGFCVWHNTTAAGQFTQTVKGWRAGKITVPT